jgi:hypothetical protein
MIVNILELNIQELHLGQLFFVIFIKIDLKTC